ncbi:MAG: Mfa1 family fimbria major subunit [Rikenellaceae bacterium]
MKKITMTLAIIVAAMAMSCQKEDLAGSGTSDDQAKSAYVSLTINTSSTRAATSEGDDGTTEISTIDDENKVFSLALLTFDYNYDYIGSHQVYMTEAGSFECEVASDARRFFAVVNPTDEIWTAINAVSSFNQAAFSALPAISLTAASVSTENYKGGSASSETRGFTMVNCGSKNSSGILLESLVSVSTELSEDSSNPTPITIAVDRMVSKFEFSVSSTFDANTSDKFGESSEGSAVGEVLGVALTATNKASYLYSMIYTDELTGDNVYRTDHNMTIGQSLSEASDIIAALTENFNWLKNKDEETDKAFISPNASFGSVAETPEYVLENTVEPSYSNSNNLTQAIVKATYNPTMTSGEVLDLGTSWFKMYTTTGVGTLYLTFDEVVSMYNGNEVYGFLAGDSTKASMDVQLNNIMGSTDKTWADADLTLEVLDACTYGGYKAATVALESDYVLQYYQKAVNFYDVFIQHDDSQTVGHVGRWGMVRNNSYTMDVTGIVQEGLPYIPDPTDPEIVDPENQDPTDPEPADKLNTYISVTISVNPWVLWYQESPLL